MNPLSVRVGALAAALTLVVAGCGSGDDGDAASAGQTLRYVAVGAPATAINDPHGGIGNQSDLTRFALLYDVLTKPRPDGTTEPRLATSFEPDESLTTWTVKLRSGVTFTDGKPVRAADVLFSLRRIQQKAAENFGRLQMFDFAESRTVDDQTLELVVTKPYAEVPRALESITFVVPEGTTAFDKPVVGSGPYTMAGGTAQHAILERNDRWWGTRPPTRRIEIRAVLDPQARAQAVISGQADVASSVNPATVRQVANDRRVKVVHRPAVTMYPFVMRLDRKPFDDPRVREAIKLATDRQELLDKVFLGYGKVGNDLLTPADPSSPTGLPQRARDLTRAKVLLEQAGHGDGLSLTLATTTSYPGMDTAATLFARQLARVGITVKVTNEPPDTYWTKVFAKRDFYTGFFGGIPFSDVARVSLLGDAPTNETAWKRPAWDAAFHKAMGVKDDAERRRAFGDLQRELRDEGGYVVWGVGDGLDLASTRVNGLPDGPGFGSVFIERVRLGG
ncbi:ABC transporter substrate-binding protein [Thermomonospora umbrina]|uniref:Peptide/nickel transport system substrate-binding protein n=1 Tax=Thermomonospora umbrina TaxID=111806 RepID=A0A3D9STP3_9ACTN|nr:ABC transporter substrate-binding protein [Thermomonospora umbrina]REE95071.1 peptide/nickel transport system substrate-binding protein [Thermomonospora umbrina]